MNKLRLLLKRLLELLYKPVTVRMSVRLKKVQHF